MRVESTENSVNYVYDGFGKELAKITQDGSFSAFALQDCSDLMGACVGKERYRVTQYSSDGNYLEEYLSDNSWILRKENTVYLGS